MHRLILNCPEGMYVDHINGDPLDNRKCNLRITTNQQNCENRQGPYKSNKSGYRGVSFDKQHQKWEAYYWRNYKKYSVGFYSTPEAANSAVVAARARLMPFSSDALKKSDVNNNA